MTGLPTDAGRRLWQLIGPWPLRPWIVFWGLGAVNLIATSSLLRGTIVATPAAGIAAVLIPTVVASLVAVVILLAAARALPARTPRHLATYLLLLASTSVLASVAKWAIARRLDLPTATDGDYLGLQSGRAFIWTVFMLAVAGETVRRLRQQTDIAERALALSLEQQELMLVNEERSRRQVAVLLHDRVQAGLMTACLELGLASRDGANVSAAQAQAVIARLDRLRGMDVRSAARTLSPDLTSVDLRTALTELARQYEPGMRTEVRIEHAIAGGDVPLTPDTLLACYRITEQGLLNALVHGRASTCRVLLEASDGEAVRLQVVDDGRSGTGTSEPGFGSAVIDAWCRVLGGQWRLTVGAQGATLEATLPRAGRLDRLDRLDQHS